MKGSQKLKLKVVDDWFFPAATAVAKCFLDFEEEDAEEKRDDLPMMVHTSARGKVLTYEHEFTVEPKP